MKDKIIELFNGKFQVNQDLLLQYVDFCLSHKVDKRKFGKYECELHHILPKNSKCFPELKNAKEFQVFLLCKDHFIAHSLLAKMLPIQPITFAWNAMLNKTSKLRNLNLKEEITPEMYQELKTNTDRQRKDVSKGKVTCIKDGKFQQIPKEERDKSKYPTWNDIYLNVFDKKTGKRMAIKKEDYNRNDYYIHTNGNASYYNILTKEREWTPVSEKKNIHLTLNKRIFIRNSLGIIFLGCVRNLNDDNMIFGIPSEDLECQILKC